MKRRCPDPPAPLRQFLAAIEAALRPLLSAGKAIDELDVCDAVNGLDGAPSWDLMPRSSSGRAGGLAARLVVFVPKGEVLQPGAGEADAKMPADVRPRFVLVHEDGSVFLEGELPADRIRRSVYLTLRIAILAEGYDGEDPLPGEAIPAARSDSDEAALAIDGGVRRRRH